MNFKRVLVLAILVLWVVVSLAFVSILITEEPAREPFSSPTLPSRAIVHNPPAFPSRARTATAPTLSVPIKSVQLAWFYKPPREDAFESLKSYFDVFILTRQDEPFRDRLKARGRRGPFLQYLLLNAIMDPGSCNLEPYHNQVAAFKGDFCQISRAHPDWFLRDRRGKLMIETYAGIKYALMDPGKPGWRAFWLERARQFQEQFGWDGIFLDNVAASRYNLIQRGFFPAPYPDEVSYQSAVADFLKYLASQYFHPAGRPVLGNIILLQDPAVWFRYLEYLDGVMEEAFAVGWHDDYLPRAEWEAQMNRIEEAQSRGKQVILVAQGAQDDTARQQFSFASYLLVNSGRASFRYTHQNAYEEVWLYPDYQLDLGSPLGPRYRSGSGWRRDFTKEIVFVNPDTHAASIAPR